MTCSLPNCYNAATTGWCCLGCNSYISVCPLHNVQGFCADCDARRFFEMHVALNEQGTINTQDLRCNCSPQTDGRCAVKMMMWNLQDLGGGPSRGPQRDQKSIDLIAAVIRQADPDVCIILEVKVAPPPPKPPKEPPKQTDMTLRNKTDYAVFNATAKAEYDRKLAAYKKRIEKYELAMQNAKDLQTTTGYLEIGRIMDALGKDWTASALTAGLATGGESYALICKSGKADIRHAALLDDRTWWVANQLRCPMFAHAVIGAHELGLVAFHAPAPSHGEITHEAIRRIGEGLAEAGIPEYLFCSDTNLNIAADKEEAVDLALDTRFEAHVPKLEAMEEEVPMFELDEETSMTFSGLYFEGESSEEIKNDVLTLPAGTRMECRAFQDYDGNASTASYIGTLIPPGGKEVILAGVLRKLSPQLCEKAFESTAAYEASLEGIAVDSATDDEATTVKKKVEDYYSAYDVMEGVHRGKWATWTLSQVEAFPLIEFVKGETKLAGEALMQEVNAVSDHRPLVGVVLF